MKMTVFDAMVVETGHIVFNVRGQRLYKPAWSYKRMYIFMKISTNFGYKTL